MKKMFAVILSLCLCLSLFCACGAEPDPEPAIPEESEAAENEMQETAGAENNETDSNLIQNYTGTYVNGKLQDGADQVTFTENEDHSYDVVIGIFRLAELTGTGNWMDGAVELNLTDPSGEIMYGIFYPEEDGSYTLMITESNWDLLESQTKFKGFHLSEE